MGTPFKMNGFSGFGNSPVKQVNKGDTLTAQTGNKLMTNNRP
jgi:hypothetical protein